MGTTTNTKIPYPEDTGAVRQGALNMRDMANWIDPLLPVYATDWAMNGRSATFSLASGAWYFIACPDATDRSPGTSSLTQDANGIVTSSGGLFMISAAVNIANALAGSRRSLAITDSNANQPSLMQSSTNAAPSGSGAMTLQGTWFTRRGSGSSRFALWAFQDSATALQIAGVYLTVVRLSDPSGRSKW